jgi:hypothetical protein
LLIPPYSSLELLRLFQKALAVAGELRDSWFRPPSLIKGLAKRS